MAPYHHAWQDERWPPLLKRRLLRRLHRSPSFLPNELLFQMAVAMTEAGMGDKALDIIEAYGVSIAYSDLKDPSAGFHLRYLYTGDEVDIPE